jgi:hypothetical protein
MSDPSERGFCGMPVLTLPIILGVLVISFFQFMGASPHPAGRKTRVIKWGLVAHTVVMFTFVKMVIGTGLDL